MSHTKQQLKQTEVKKPALDAKEMLPGKHKSQEIWLMLVTKTSSVQRLVYIIKVRVLHGLLRRDPLCRLILQHFLQESQ
jgi:hypothetical protein